VSVSQITSELGIGMNVLGFSDENPSGTGPPAFVGHGRLRDEETALLQGVGAGDQGAEFLREAAPFFVSASR